MITPQSDILIMGQQAERLTAKAWFLGQRLDLRDYDKSAAIALSPLTCKVGENGIMVLLRFGVAVLLSVSAAEEEVALSAIKSRVHKAFPEARQEELEIIISSTEVEQIDSQGALILNKAGVSKLQTVAIALAKSTVLDHYEQRVATVFEHIETVAERLRRGASPKSSSALLREIGDTLLIQARTVGRIEVAEKPEITWDNAELDRLYERLAAEFELRERDHALTRKLELISDTAATYLDLLHNRRSLRVEWYIVILIMVEIVISLYELFYIH